MSKQTKVDVIISVGWLLLLVLWLVSFGPWAGLVWSLLTILGVLFLLGKYA